MNQRAPESSPHHPPETQTQPETTEAQEVKVRIKTQLADILTDRASFNVAPELRTVPNTLENLQIPEHLNSTAEENLRLLSMLSGHSGSKFRSLLHGNSPLANHLRTLFEWSKEAATGKTDSLETLNTEIPELLQNQTPDEIYERTTFFDLYPETEATEEAYKQALIQKMAEAVGKKLDPRKWFPETATAITKEDLTTEQLKNIIEQVGFIPRVIYNTKKFRDIEAPRVTSLITRLREIQGSTEDDEADQGEDQEQIKLTKKAKIKQRANTERARLLNTLLTSPQAEHLRKYKTPLTVEVDGNGLFIQGENFGSHLPFGLVEEKTIEALGKPSEEKPALLNTSQILEVKVRQAAQNGEYQAYQKRCEEQLLEYAHEMNWREDDTKKMLHGTGTHSHALLGNIYTDSWEKITTEAEHIVKNKIIVPDLLLKRFGKQQTLHPANAGILLEGGEKLSNQITKEKLSLFSEDLHSYALLGQAEQTYKARESVVNSPAYVNVAKIARFYLQYLPTSGIEKHHSRLIFRGELGNEGRKEDHEFIEILIGRHIHRVLVNRNKHLSQFERESLDELPLLSEEKYKTAEDKLRVYQNFMFSLDSLKNDASIWNGPRLQDAMFYMIDHGEDPRTLYPNLREKYLKACENMLFFTRANIGKPGSGTEQLHEMALNLYEKLRDMQNRLLNPSDPFLGKEGAIVSNVQVMADRAKKLIERLKTEKTRPEESLVPHYDILKQETLDVSDEKDALLALVDIFSKARELYEKQLFEHILEPETVETEKNKNKVSIKVVRFGNSYLRNIQELQARGLCEPGGYHLALCEQGFETTVAQINLEDNELSSMLPIELEIKALKAIHYKEDPECPLIIAYGGAKFIEKKASNKSGDNHIGNVPRDLLSVLHELPKKGNIAVPGTQSGIGIDFAAYYTQYMREFGHLKEADRLFMFAISPGANIYYPGNTMSKKFPGEETFGMSPIPTIATPNAARWHIMGRERLSIPYVHQSARAADMYERASYNQKRLISLSNGGLFSMLDTSETLKYDIPLVIHHETGRLAEATACIIENDALPDIDNREKFNAEVLKIIKDKMRAESKDYFLGKDFGAETEPSTENQQIYREQYFLFLRQIRAKIEQNPKLIRVVNPEETQSVIREILTSKSEIIRKS